MSFLDDEVDDLIGLMFGGGVHYAPVDEWDEVTPIMPIPKMTLPDIDLEMVPVRPPDLTPREAVCYLCNRERMTLKSTGGQAVCEQCIHEYVLGRA